MPQEIQLELHQQRVVDEKRELDEKISKLEPFIKSNKFDSLSMEERSLLRAQLLAMQSYTEILLKRIAFF